MKKLTLVCASLMLSALLMFATAAPSTALPRDNRATVEKAANVEVILQNKCTRDVKYSLKVGATTTNGVVPKGDKVKVNVAVGTEICVDGDAFMTVAAADAGQTFMVCR
jgi:hypothetical protein